MSRLTPPIAVPDVPPVPVALDGTMDKPGQASQPDVELRGHMGRLWRLVRDLSEAVRNLSRSSRDVSSGGVTDHEATHLVGGSDAFPTPGAPTGVNGGSAVVGSGPAFAREDHKHAFTLLTAKGQIAGHNGSTPVAIQVAQDPGGGTAGGGFPSFLLADNDYADGAGWWFPWRPYIFPPDLVNNVVSNMMYAPLAANGSVGIVIDYIVFVRNGTHVQTEIGRWRFLAARNHAGLAVSVNSGLESLWQVDTSGAGFTTTWAYIDDTTLNNRLILTLNVNSLMTGTPAPHVQFVFNDLYWDIDVTFPYAL